MASQSQPATERRPITPYDLWEMRFITDMRLSPDERFIAYRLESNDRASNQRRSAIWLLDTLTGGTRQLTFGKRDGAPRWSPDGHWLAFTRKADDNETQLWVLPVAGGEARQLTYMRRGVGAPFWSADSRWIGFESEVREGEEAILSKPRDAATREREQKDEAEHPRIITRLQYRWDGRGYLEGRTHLFRAILPADENAQAIVEPLTEGDYDNEEGACSPDGRWLVFVSDRADDRDANMTSDLWLLNLQTLALRRVTDGLHSVAQPVWSPDGSRIAYLATPKIRDHSAYNTALMVMDVATGEAVSIVPENERQAISFEDHLYSDIPLPHLSAPIWSVDGTALYALAAHGGSMDLLRVATTTPQPEHGEPIAHIISGRDTHITQVTLAPATQRIFTLQCDPTHLWDIWEYTTTDAPGQLKARAQTSVNAALLAQRLLSLPERFTYRSFDGQEIEAWLYRPVNTKEGAQPKRRTKQAPNTEKLAPLVLRIHGGPHSAYGQSFFLRVQVLCGLGYALLYANPRGSDGYGEAFAQACDYDWGGGDYHDLMAGVDAALTRGGLDPDRLAVFGASYGGYMTNWIVTQTDRFRAAVTVNSVTNLLSSFGVGDIDSVWAEGDYGWPWEREEWYLERSPLTHVAQITTPIRIIAAENDYRCPISQSEELYTWIKRLGKAPVDFVRMPGASHAIYATPRQMARAIELEVEWFTRYCPVE